MNEELQPIVDDIKTSVTKAVTEEVYQKLKDELPQRKDVFGGDNTNAKEQLEGKEKAAAFIKAKFIGDQAQVKALSEGTATEGNELVPEVFSNEIIRVIPNYGVVRRLARNFDVSGAGYITHLPTVGSVTAYRVGEGAAITSSQPSTGQLNITIKKLAALVPMNNELLKDANVNTVDIIATLTGEALANKEDVWGLLGLASGEGIFQTSGVPAKTLASTHTTYASVTFDDLLDTLGLLDESALAGARWIMSFSVFNALRKLKNTSGTNSYILQEPGDGRPATIWNIPVEFSRVMPKTTDASQAGKNFIALANMDYMLFADKREYTLDISREASMTDTDGSTPLNLFEQDMSAVRVIERIDVELAEPTKAFAVVKTAAS